MTNKPPSPSHSIGSFVTTAAVFVLIAVPASILTYAVAAVIASGGFSPAPVKIVPVDASSQTSSDYTFSFPDHAMPVPELNFVDGNGRPLTLSGFRGRPVLLNIWATWCVPCRKEMPSLDRLQAKFDPSKLQVLTLSIDHQGIPAVKKFYDDLGLKSLRIFVDQSASAGNKLHLPGVPGTLLIDAQGLEVGRKLGPAAWDSPQVVALLGQHLSLGSSPKTGESAK